MTQLKILSEEKRKMKHNMMNTTSIQAHVKKSLLKWAAVKTWLYEFWNGHPFLLSEEVDIICETREEQKYKWMNDEQIQELIEIRIKRMYKKKFPNAKWCGLLPI